MQYVKDGKIVKLPLTAKLKDGGMRMNFNLSSDEYLLYEGYKPVTVINNETFDSDIETRTGPVITENADHVVFDYTVTGIPLDELIEAKRIKIVREGKALIAAKYNEADELSRKFMTTQEEADMDSARDADITILKTYFVTSIRPQLDNADTPLKVKNITYTWPTI